MRAKLLAVAVASALSMGLGQALAPRGLGPVGVPSFLLTAGGGKGTRKHRKGGSYSGRRPGHRNRSRYSSHQGAQECARRVAGGWAQQIRLSSMTKERAIFTARLHKAGYLV